MKCQYLLLLLFGLAIRAQTPTPFVTSELEPGSPQSVGMSPERLKRIDAMLQTAIRAGEIPGAVALVARKGKMVLSRAYGTADPVAGSAYKTDAIFRIASQTKAITSTAVMMLWEAGHFKLDDPISKYIPEFSETGILESFNEADSSFTVRPPEKPITIRHLLSHTSGIGYGMIDGDERFRKIYARAGIVDAFTAEPITLEDNIPRLAGMPLHHEPGANWTYSEGLDVLGRLIEIVSGISFDQFLKTRIFDPLGMEDTWFYLPADKAYRLVPVQHRVDGEWKVFETNSFEIDYPKTGARSYFSGGAGLSSTARDYAIFLQMYLNGGAYKGVRILSRTTVNTMMANQIGAYWADGPKDFGLAFALTNTNGLIQGGLGSPGTFDWGGYFNTQYFADPKEGIIGILLKQTQNAAEDQTGWKFRQMVFAAIDD